MRSNAVNALFFLTSITMNLLEAGYASMSCLKHQFEEFVFIAEVTASTEYVAFGESEWSGVDILLGYIWKGITARPGLG